jgi:putative FmdB family regulatory protein
MPTYDYECSKCKHRFELRRSFSDNGHTARCPKCKGRSQRIFTSVPVIFKGSGFYVTDHRKPGTDGDGEKPAPAAEKQPEKKVEPVKADSK